MSRFRFVKKKRKFLCENFIQKINIKNKCLIKENKLLNNIYNQVDFSRAK
jgi:hypothetical protein